MTEYEFKMKYDDDFFDNFQQQYGGMSKSERERESHNSADRRSAKFSRSAKSFKPKKPAKSQKAVKAERNGNNRIPNKSGSYQNSIAADKSIAHTTATAAIKRKHLPRKKRRIKRGVKNAVLGFAAAVLAVIIACLVLPNCFGGTGKKGEPYRQIGVQASADDTAQSSSAIKPFEAADNVVTLGDDVNCKNCVLVDVTDNKILAQKDADAVIYPASMTKILTLITAVENMTDPNATFTFSYEITDPLYVQEASVVGFSAGETVGVNDMLYGSILASGADATVGLAITVSGSEDAFVTAMNKKVQELGLTTATFKNTSGLHDPEHKCTVKDMAILLDYAMKNETCRKVLTSESYTTAPTEQHPEGVTVTSTLFSRIYGAEPEGATIIAGKTGYTTEAGNCIASYAKGDNGHNYVFVSAGGTDKWKAVYDHINVYSAYAKG